MVAVSAVEVGGDAAGEEGEKEDEDDEGKVDDCRGVHDVAYAGEGRDDASDDVARYADNGGCFAGMLASFVHGEGVGRGENHAEGEEKDDIADIIDPEAVESEKFDSLHYDGACGDDGAYERRFLIRFEFQREHRACRHEEGVEADYESVFGLRHSVMVLHYEGRGGDVVEEQSEGEAFETGVRHEVAVAQQSGVSAER